MFVDERYRLFFLTGPQCCKTALDFDGYCWSLIIQGSADVGVKVNVKMAQLYLW
jgi:hypothetical protein